MCNWSVSWPCLQIYETTFNMTFFRLKNILVMKSNCFKKPSQSPSDSVSENFSVLLQPYKLMWHSRYVSSITVVKCHHDCRYQSLRPISADNCGQKEVQYRLLFLFKYSMGPLHFKVTEVLSRGSVAERSKALDLGSSLSGGVGSNPTAANLSIVCLKENVTELFLTGTHQN